MNTANSTAPCLYRSEAFAEDLPDWQEQANAGGRQRAAGAPPESAPTLSTLNVALLCALPLGAAVLGAVASAWG